jgi:hypothetical protein
MRSTYWTCSRFADWLRGTAKLSSGTADEWDEWRTTAETKHKFRFWLAEEGLNIAQNFFYGPVELLYSIKYYINNRFVSRSHALTAHPRDIKPGNWCDVGNRFLPCLFNELVDFVEIECAWHNIVWNDVKREQYGAPWWASGWWRLRKWRCREAGIDNLNWQMSLLNEADYPEVNIVAGTPTSQAIAAREIYDLYIWWTETRVVRADPYEASGWSAYCEQKRELNGDRLFGSKTTPELEELSKTTHERLHEIEASYEAQDTEMMIRLIKIRNSLWT